MRDSLLGLLLTFAGVAFSTPTFSAGWLSSKISDARTGSSCPHLEYSQLNLNPLPIANSPFFGGGISESKFYFPLQGAPNCGPSSLTVTQWELDGRLRGTDLEAAGVFGECVSKDCPGQTMASRKFIVHDFSEGARALRADDVSSVPGPVLSLVSEDYHSEQLRRAITEVESIDDMLAHSQFDNLYNNFDRVSKGAMSIAAFRALGSERIRAAGGGFQRRTVRETYITLDRNMALDNIIEFAAVTGRNSRTFIELIWMGAEDGAMKLRLYLLSES
jgi:hypothetical protein